MTIAVQINPAFDIETYDGLVAYIIAHMELDTETAAQVPTFIRKAEYRLNRLVTAPERETSASLTTTAGTQSAPLPLDYRQLRGAKLVADNGMPLQQVSLEALTGLYSTSRTGRPQVYAISEESLAFGPTPDAAYRVDIVYHARLPALSDANQSNWLLATNADAYVYFALMQAAGWLEDFDAAQVFKAEGMAIIEEVNLSGSRYRNGAPLAPRVACVP